MSLFRYAPVTSSSRSLVTLRAKGLWKGKPFKSLTRKKNSTGGRNNIGRMTVRGSAGASKRRYRIIDFTRSQNGEGKVLRIEYDPNRTSNIALVKYNSGVHGYIIAPKGIVVGDIVMSSATTSLSIKIGNSMPMRVIPVGTYIHNIETKLGKGGQIARSAGSFAVLVSKKNGKANVKLPSSEVIVLSDLCRATIGQVSNLDIKNVKYGKAGRKRWLGCKPKVRGVAMNPIDHPHGGGEGKTSGGRHPVNKNGKPTKGYRTRNNKRTNSSIIKSRHK